MSNFLARPKDSREPVPALAPSARASNDDLRNDSGEADTCAPKALAPSQEQDALMALRGLEFPVRRAKLLLRRILAEQPAARGSSLVRAVVLQHGHRTA